MFRNIKRNLMSDRVASRIITTYIIFLIIFILVTIISYFLLPEGFLRNKHPLQKWDTSVNLAISTLQILSYNLISVIMILFANMFLYRRKKVYDFIPLGYTAFFLMIAINAIVLGTWSFSVVTEAVPLMDRIIRTFDLLHRAGLWEMSGQLLILCATAKISLIIIDAEDLITKNWKTLKLSKQEIFFFAFGLFLMIIGAFVESYSILSVI